MSTESTPQKAHVEFTSERRELFLRALANSGNVRAACQAAKIDRSTAYNHRKADDAFAEAWDEALDDAIDVLEAIAWKRAEQTSDTLLIFLLKAHRRSLYGDKQTLGFDKDAPLEVIVDIGTSLNADAETQA